MSRALPLILLGLLLAGCTSAGTGTFALRVTDAPDDIGDFAYLNVTVERIALTPKGGSATDHAPSASTFDLARLTNGNLTTIFNGTVAAGNYTRLDLFVSNATGVLAADGSSAEVAAPGGRLFLNTAFEVAEGKETEFVFDIQVHQEGNGDYAFKPNADGSGPRGKP